MNNNHNSGDRKSATLREMVERAAWLSDFADLCEQYGTIEVQASSVTHMREIADGVKALLNASPGERAATTGEAERIVAPLVLVDELLAQAGYAPDSSARHNLSIALSNAHALRSQPTTGEREEAARWHDEQARSLGNSAAPAGAVYELPHDAGLRRDAHFHTLAASALRALRSAGSGVTEEIVTRFLEADQPYFTRRSSDKSTEEVCRHTSREVIEPVVVGRYENTPGGRVSAEAMAKRLNTRAALTAAGVGQVKVTEAFKSVHDLVPPGWVLRAADCSVRPSVTLMRDKAGHSAWNALSEGEREVTELYQFGTGDTLEDAVRDAANKAAALPALAAAMSEKVERFEPTTTGEGWNFGDAIGTMETDPNGEWVRYSDYTALESELARLRSTDPLLAEVKEGWFLKSVDWDRTSKMYEATLICCDDEGVPRLGLGIEGGTGPTPLAAVRDAASKTTENC